LGIDGNLISLQTTSLPASVLGKFLFFFKLVQHGNLKEELPLCCGGWVVALAVSAALFSQLLISPVQSKTLIEN
jgi:hypothetical protein